MTPIALMLLVLSALTCAESRCARAGAVASGRSAASWRCAAARQDYNAFHDLAWRALQAGPKNDPALMTMLARAQSLSGRPRDALVMLQRLAAMGVVTDAATSDDFSGVRACRSWPEFEARVYKWSGIPAPDKSPASPAPMAAPASEPSACESRVETAAASKREAGIPEGRTEERRRRGLLRH